MPLAFYFTLLPENSDLTGFWDSVLSVLFSDLHISEMRFSLGFGPSKCCSVWAVLVLADVWPNNQIQVLSANILLGWGKMNANSSTTMQYESKKSINVVNAYIVVTVQHIFYLQAGKWDLLNGFRSSTHQNHYGLNMHINILTTYLRYYSRIEPLGNISCEIWGLLGNAGPACGWVSECYGSQNAVSDITSILQSPYISS